MKDNAFIGKHPIHVIDFLAVLKRACDSSKAYEAAYSLLSRKFMNVPVVAAIKAIFILLINKSNIQGGTTTS